MQVKVDEDLPVAVAEALAAAGHDTVRVADQGMGGWLDPPLWAAVQREGRFFVTADKGFGDIRGYPPGTHAGILVLRPDEDGVRPQVDLVAKVLSRYRLEDLAGGITVASPRGIRIRHPPRAARRLSEGAEAGLVGNERPRRHRRVRERNDEKALMVMGRIGLSG